MQSPSRGTIPFNSNNRMIQQQQQKQKQLKNHEDSSEFDELMDNKTLSSA